MTTGPKEEAVNVTITGTGSGILDDARGPREDFPEPPSDEELERLKVKLGVK